MADYVVGVSAGIAYGVSYVSRQPRRNLEVVTRYAPDPRYMGMRNLRDKHNRSYFGLDFAYNVIPNQLVPFDYDTVAESVKKTGRLVVVHEAHQNNGWGAQVVSQVSQMVFPYLDAAPVHIGAKACPLPFNLGLEQAVLPSVKDIVDACKASLYR